MIETKGNKIDLFNHIHPCFLFVQFYRRSDREGVWSLDGVLRDISISITTRLQHIQWLTGPGGFFGHVSVAERQISGNLSIGPLRMCFEQ